MIYTYRAQKHIQQEKVIKIVDTFQSTLGNSTTKTKKHLLMSKKTFDAVEKKMNHIQASLSSTSLAKGSNNQVQGSNQGTNQQTSETEDCTVLRLRRELEDKEKLALKGVR